MPISSSLGKGKGKRLRKGAEPDFNSFVMIYLFRNDAFVFVLA